MNILAWLATACSLLVVVNCDCYLHSPRGTNNRLNEKSATRTNNNRIFNSQNNNRGGYNVGDSTTSYSKNEAQQYRMNYFQSGTTGDTELTVEWTNQHGCGGDEDHEPHKLNCNLVMQVMCQDDIDTAAPDDSITFRNGKNTDTQAYSKPESDVETQAEVNARRDADVRDDRVLHESWEWYDSCYRRERNKGLFTADQDLDVNDLGVSSAIFTRQSANENRYGYECPEERDYYPYFHPTPWMDVAILAQNESLCDYYEQNSFSHRTYGECVEQFSPSERKHWSTINNPTDCAEQEGAQWVEYHSYLELAPQFTSESSCLQQNNQQSRVTYKWGKPYDVKKIVEHNNIEDACFVAPPALDCKAAGWTRVNHLGNSKDLTPLNYTWTIPYFPSGNKKRCILRMRYNISTDDYDPYNTDSSSNQIEEDGIVIKKSPVQGNPLVNIGARQQPLQLAINTAQTGRTFQDRSHIFFLSPRPAEIAQDTRVLNLNVRGKRGNIVQVYPAVEYDFIPNQLYITESDLVHIQWTGSNSHNNGNPAGDGAAGSAGTGKAGTDRSNIVELQKPGENYIVPYENSSLFQNLEVVWSSFGIYGNAREDIQKNVAIQLASSGYFKCALKNDCGADSVQSKSTMRNQLDNVSPSFPGLIVRFKEGTYYYMCSRNNNFTNRSQKGTIVVKSN